MVSDVFECEVLAPGLAAGSFRYVDISGSSEPEDGRQDSDPAVEAGRLRNEVATLASELAGWVERLASRGLGVEADVVRSHVALLNDRQLHEQIIAHIRERRCSAERAVESVLDALARRLESAGDQCIGEKATDLRDLSAQLVARLNREQWDRLPRILDGVADPVLAVPELFPSIVLKAAGLGVRAFVVERGTSVSHGVILARALGVPAVKTQLLPELRAMHGQAVTVDGERGRLTFATASSPAAKSAPADSAGKAAAVRGRIRSPSVPVELLVNIIDPSQLEGFDWTGVAGVGLYRTESLFVQRHDDFPSEQQQYQTYRRLFELCGDRPITFRTADIGGDKAVSYLSIGSEPNPYLGLRGPRLYRFHPDLVTTQLQAVLRAADGRDNLNILYPMINCIDDWQDLQVLYGESADLLRREGVRLPKRVGQGILIETPSAALDFERFLDVIDFASVGTNDLVQYLFAVDRNNANVAHLYQPEHPIVLRVLADLAARAESAGKPLSICGEIAGQPRFVPPLVGLGFRRLSVSPPAVEAVRRRLSRLRLDDCRSLARECLAASSAEAVRALLGRRSPRGPVAEPHRVDPVCGMAVRTQGNPFTIWHDGVRYSFCSRRCMLRFFEGHHGPVSPSGDDKQRRT